MNACANISLACSLSLALLFLAEPLTAQPEAMERASADASALRIVQLVEDEPVRRHHPSALPSLLRQLNEDSAFRIHPDPVFISSFADPRLFSSPVTYVNFADRDDWTLSEAEVESLRLYLANGGFLYIDAGINSEFLRGDRSLGQSHSFADWEVTPELEEQFRRVFPERDFAPLPRSHPIFQGFFRGLPDPTSLPEAIRDFIVEEKWPQGSYAAVGLTLASGRLAVLTTPILALGWGKDRFGRWDSTISFRVREAAEGMDQRLQSAAFSGTRFQARREDGSLDMIYTQPPHVPAWVQEPDGRWRVFRYYHGPEISDYAHTFYTRLGINLFIYLLAENR